MKKILFTCVIMVASLFLLTGCPQKTTPVIDMSNQTTLDGKSADSKLSGIDGIDKENVSKDELAANLARLIEQLQQNSQNIYFAFDKYNISDDMISSIEHNAKLFNSEEAKSLTIRIEGNCDEWGTDEYNYALGLRRAKSVKDALIANGVDGNRIIVISYGESNPVCTESTINCWQQNRRAEFRLLP